MKIKTIFLALFFCLISLLIIGQTAKEYFIPQGNNNMSNFSSPVFNLQIWFIPISSNQYKIVEVNFLQGTIASKQTNYVIISENEIKVTKVEFGSNQEKTHNTPTTWLKLPKTGETISWYYTNINAMSKCTAEWTTVIIINESKKAIRVKLQPYEDGKLLDTGIKYDYYVEGIGFYKRELQNGKNFYEFINQQFDPSCK
jgi:hypothetical protein